MNKYEELLAKASACLTDVSKIEAPLVQAKVLDLVYHSQMVAQEIILKEINSAWSKGGASNGADSPGNKPVDL